MKGKTKLIILFAIVAVWITHIKAGESADSLTPEKGSAPLSVSDSGAIAASGSPSVQDGNTSMDTCLTEKRPTLISQIPVNHADFPIPCAETYSVAPDLSNIDNLWQFYFEEEAADKLSKNGFLVSGTAGQEFFEVYEQNRYLMLPSFITVDSLMHTYHLYFSHLLKRVEKEFLSDKITLLSKAMLKNSIAQYDKLKGSEWETAARRNVAFFTVGTKLLDENTAVNAYVKETVEHELDLIHRANSSEISEITGLPEDFTQYIPRGYYEGDEQLEQYFKAMMWYGRIHFVQANEDLDRSALLIAKALADDEECIELWQAIYAVTSFFAGASDDMGVCEYASAIHNIYGSDISIEDFIGNEEAFNRFHIMIASLSTAQVNSIPYGDDGQSAIAGFRFMGQRFTIDAFIMQKLVYDNVDKDKDGNYRMLPDVLDVPAALGNDIALHILEAEGSTGYDGYMENMSQLRQTLSEENTALWSSGLYASWLHTLRPLLDCKGEGYPFFMQSEEWAKKDLECFAGSFTELKHDTVLYSKQVIAEMGGGYEEEPDDRGYVEPEPLVYARFATLADSTGQGLEKYGMLLWEDQENLSRLSQIAKQLLEISNKELNNEPLTVLEYEFIRSYGGYLEHFWYDAVRETNGSENISTQEVPAALVVDIATDLNGRVLEAATGNPSKIYVAVKVDGKVKIACGSVYSFYQFTYPFDASATEGDRMTDSAWRQMIGLAPDESGNYNYDASVQKPDWTNSYRYTPN